MTPQPASPSAHGALPASLRLALLELDGGLRSWTETVELVLRGLASSDQRTRRRALFSALALARRSMEGASEADVSARRGLALKLERLEGDNMGFRRVRVCISFPHNLSVVGRDAAGNAVKAGLLGHTYGTSLYDEHQELPIAGIGWRRDRVFVMDEDGSQRPIGAWLRARGTFVLCSRCGADVTDVYAPRTCPWRRARSAAAVRPATEGPVHASAHAPTTSTVRRQPVKHAVRPAKTAPMQEPSPTSTRVPRQALTWTLDGVLVAGAAQKVSASIIHLVITDPSGGTLAGRVSYERSNPLSARPLWKGKTLTEEGRALVDARARAWVPHWLRLTAHATELEHAVNALLPSWRAARAAELEAERGRARVQAEWRRMRREGLMDEAEHARRLKDLRRREAGRGAAPMSDAGAALWRQVVEAARGVAGVDVDPWVLARFLDARRGGG